MELFLKTNLQEIKTAMFWPDIDEKGFVEGRNLVKAFITCFQVLLPTTLLRKPEIACVITYSFVFQTYPSGAEEAPQLFGCLPSALQTLGAPCKPEWWHMPIIPAHRRWRQEDQMFKVSLSYVVISRAAWATRDPAIVCFSWQLDKPEKRNPQLRRCLHWTGLRAYL